MRLLAFAAFALAAAPAHAQADVLCGSLGTIIAAAADRPAPFASVGAQFPESAAIASIDDLPPGLQSAEKCEAHMPASSSLWGAAAGEYWEFACTLYSATDAGNPDARAEFELHRDNMVKRARACLAPKGWSDAPVTTPGARPPLGGLDLVKTGTIVSVHVTHAVTGASRREQSYLVTLSIRLNGGPKPPKPPPTAAPSRD